MSRSKGRLRAAAIGAVALGLSGCAAYDDPYYGGYYGPHYYGYGYGPHYYGYGTAFVAPRSHYFYDSPAFVTPLHRRRWYHSVPHTAPPRAPFAAVRPAPPPGGLYGDARPHSPAFINPPRPRPPGLGLGLPQAARPAPPAPPPAAIRPPGIGGGGAPRPRPPGVGPIIGG